MALSVTSGSGTGGEQSNPQSAVTDSEGTISSGNVQPGTPTQDLTSSNGISLYQQPLTTVNLSAGTASGSTKPAQSNSQHMNPALLAAAILLFATAAVVFWVISRSGKKYNQYD